MDLKNAKEVDSLLSVLKSHGVEEFDGLGIKVKLAPFTPADFAEQLSKTSPTGDAGEPKSPLDDPDLYLSAKGP